jgi:hypothetical protein
MIKDAIEYIVNLARPTLTPIDAESDAFYSDRRLNLYLPALQPTVAVSTLTGLADAIAAMGITGCLLLVESPTSVSCQAIAADHYGRRQEFVAATHVSEQFQFGRFMSSEEMIIGLRSKFILANGDDLDYVCQMAGNVATGTEAATRDDGVTQDVSIKRGVSLRGVAQLRPIVQLTPMRTFSEVGQVTSPFLFRAKSVGPDAPPQLALFEADGGAWKVVAAEIISRWLKANPATGSLVTVR